MILDDGMGFMPAPPIKNTIFCLQAASTDKPEFTVLAHRPDTIDAWALSLKHRFQGQPIAVRLDLAKSPLVYALQKYDFLVLFPRSSFHIPYNMGLLRTKTFCRRHSICNTITIRLTPHCSVKSCSPAFWNCRCGR